MKRRIQAADSIRFYVRGRGAQRLLGQAAQAGLKLERIAPQADGFTAVMSGAGWAKLCQLAGAGGWQVIQMQRRGPGPLAERLLRRPGILAGIGLFFVLLHWWAAVWQRGAGVAAVWLAAGSQPCCRSLPGAIFAKAGIASWAGELSTKERDLPTGHQQCGAKQPDGVRLRGVLPCGGQCVGAGDA